MKKFDFIVYSYANNYSSKAVTMWKKKVLLKEIKRIIKVNMIYDEMYI